MSRLNFSWLLYKGRQQPPDLRGFENLGGLRTDFQNDFILSFRAAIALITVFSNLAISFSSRLISTT